VDTSASPVTINRYTSIRERIYRVLLRYPRDEWTVRALATATGPDISPSAVRDTIYMLIAAAAMSVVPGNRAITVQLTAAGRTRLQSIEKTWRSARAADPQPDPVLRQRAATSR
jgi:hypothetical protein